MLRGASQGGGPDETLDTANHVYSGNAWLGLSAPIAMADTDNQANATVSFGAWQTGPALGPLPVDELDRSPINSPASRNEHQLLPQEVKIKAGGAVNFIIGGFHQVIVYDKGTQPDVIDEDNTTPSTGTPAGLALINDANNRIYRGLDPSRLRLVGTPPLGVRDRVEVVFFQNPGTYLVFGMSSTGVESRYASDSGHWQHSV
jgi:hypothetical protein